MIYPKAYIFCILIFSSFFERLSSQKLSSFYIEPSNSWKINLTENPSTPKLSLPHLEMEAMRLTYPSGLLVSSAGINAGYRFKNSDKLQIGVMYDDSQQGFRYAGLEQNQNTVGRISQTKGSYLYRLLYYNISFLYKRNVLYIKSRALNEDRFVRVHLVIGLNYCSKPNNGIELMDTYISRFMAPDSSVYTISSETYALPTRFYGLLKLNAGLDITFGKGSREWFSINVNLQHGGQSYLSYIQTEVNVTKNNVSQTYGLIYRGTGNGIYFTISRRFFLDFKKNKNSLKPYEFKDVQD